MSVYFVRIETRTGGRSRPIVGLDWTREQLLSRLVQPYLRGDGIMVSGYALTHDDIVRVQIHESDRLASEWLPIVYEQHPYVANGFFSKDEWFESFVARQGQDVTDQWLTQSSTAAMAGPETDPRAVFVVYGRDLRSRNALFEFLCSVGLQPLEWEAIVNQVGQATPYTGEVVAHGVRVAQAVVVLMTGDDQARLQPTLGDDPECGDPTSWEPQPRPNVLFEAGMAMALARDRTILVEVGRLRGLSDLYGLNVVRFDGSVQARKQLINRLRTAGCPIDEGSDAWQEAGNFSHIPSAPSPTPPEGSSGGGPARSNRRSRHRPMLRPTNPTPARTRVEKVFEEVAGSLCGRNGHDSAWLSVAARYPAAFPMDGAWKTASADLAARFFGLEPTSIDRRVLSTFVGCSTLTPPHQLLRLHGDGILDWGCQIAGDPLLLEDVLVALGKALATLVRHPLFCPNTCPDIPITIAVSNLPVHGVSTHGLFDLNPLGTSLPYGNCCRQSYGLSTDNALVLAIQFATYLLGEEGYVGHEEPLESVRNVLAARVRKALP